MISTRLFASTPFRNLSAFLDFSGTFYLYHIALQQRIALSSAQFYGVLPIGDGRGSEDWLRAVQETHNRAARSLGIASSPDLTSYDLSQEADHSAWFFAVSNDLERLRLAAGLV